MSRLAPASLALAVVAIAALGPSSSATAFGGGGWGLLDSGHAGIYSWRVDAKRQGGPARAGARERRPACVRVAVKRQRGPFSYTRVRFRTCADRAGSPKSSTEPLLASAAIAARTGSPALTAVGVIVAPPVRRLRITLTDGGSRTVRLDRLSPGGVAGAELGRLRYAAFTAPGLWAPQRIVALSASGRVLWDSSGDGPVGPPS